MSQTTTFQPGKIIGTFQAKNGDEVTFRHLEWSDLDQLTEYINQLSSENTFIRFSGEVITKEQESDFLASLFLNASNGDKVYVVATINGRIVGGCDVERNKINFKRSLHCGVFGISLLPEYRGQGIGFALSQAVIAEAISEIAGLKQLLLTVFGPNINAQALYLKLGFREVGRIPQHILHRGEYVDEVQMVREL